jgi:pimeloyl-ACP methyl ester carboxylesterase
MDYPVKQEGKFRYIEEGQGETLLLLHGLFGAMSNFRGIVDYFRNEGFRVVVPILPLFDLDLLNTSVGGLQKFVHKFIEHKDLRDIHLLGNSLGGHVALVYVLKHPERVRSLILTGSSGLFEHGMGDSYPKRGDYDYIRQKTEQTFYDPKTATKELVDEVFGIVNERIKVIKILALAKSAIRNNLSDELKEIDKPTLLIWGNNDIVTPPYVGREFQRLIRDSELHFIDKCGHAPMMELPDEFNVILKQFLLKLRHTEPVS